ncbi:MAG: HAMP domain-containing sensor histidine kinase [Thomasclavelia sp.]
MNTKKIIFSIIAVLILLTSSVGIYFSYDFIETDNQKNIDFSKNQILYDILDTIYPVSFQLDNIGKKEGIPKYITANSEASNEFYQNSILYNREIMSDKKNIKYYAEGNNNSLSNTNNDIKNIYDNDALKEKYQWYLKINFDENGQLSYDSLGCSTSANQNYELIWNNYKQAYFQYLEAYDENVVLHNPTNFTIYLAVPYKLSSDSIDTIAWYATGNSLAANVENITPFVIIAIIVVSLFILFYPYEIVKEINIFSSLAKIKLEILLCILSVLFAGVIAIIYALIIDTLNGYYISKLSSVGFGKYSEIILSTMNIGTWIIFLFLCMFTVYYIKSIFKEGIISFLKNNMLCCWIIRTLKKIFNKIISFDFNDNINKIVLKIVIVNGLIISIICCFFIFGVFFTLIYSIILFIILKNKFEAIKQDYQILLNSVQRLSNGDFDVEINQDLGLFNPLKTEFTNIKDGFEKAVNEEVKSQKMKTELISNVSHDLKTPLTSIITYIDLLKEENLNDNKRNEYINTLNRNAFRLKNLIDDLFEISKANSGNIKLNIVDVDIVALIQQTKFELTDNFTGKNLIFKTVYPKEKIILKLDSQKTYRIFENLLINISKYALENTRVYIEVINYTNKVEIIFKNISSDEIKISANELVGRFVQGNKSRNTSGSGLGLAIVKSFTELQNGIFKIEVDGDLFKAIVVFKK